MHLNFCLFKMILICQVSVADRAEIQFWAMRFTYILVKKCPNWIAGQQQLVDTIR